MQHPLVTGLVELTLTWTCLAWLGDLLFMRAQGGAGRFSRTTGTLHHWTSFRTREWPQHSNLNLPVVMVLVALLVGLALVHQLGTLRSLHARQRSLRETHRTPAQISSSASNGIADELLLAIITQCMKQQDTLIWCNNSDHEVVASFDAQIVEDATCPLIDIMLAAPDRSIGLCTDAAIYVHTLGARILPASVHMANYDTHCGNRTARMSLEPLYESWVSCAPGRLHIFAPNWEQALQSDHDLHQCMHLIICKVKRCELLFREYVKDMGSNAQVLYTGAHKL